MRYANYSGTMNSLLRNETKNGNRKYVVISRHVYIYMRNIRIESDKLLLSANARR